MVEILEVESVEQLEQARSLLRRYQSELPAAYRFPDSEWQNLPGDYRPPGGALLLATVAGQPAGCVGLRSFPLDGACEMKRLYVPREFRGAKLGVSLIEHIIQVARTLGYSRMRLDTHLPTMGTAVELYSRFGFADVAPWPLPRVQGLSYLELPL